MGSYHGQPNARFGVKAPWQLVFPRFVMLVAHGANVALRRVKLLVLITKPPQVAASKAAEIKAAAAALGDIYSWNVFPNAAFPASSSLSGGSSVGGRGALLLLLSSANESGS